jgi:hypothetical protein
MDDRHHHLIDHHRNMVVEAASQGLGGSRHDESEERHDVGHPYRASCSVWVTTIVTRSVSQHRRLWEKGVLLLNGASRPLAWRRCEDLARVTRLGLHTPFCRDRGWMQGWEGALCLSWSGPASRACPVGSSILWPAGQAQGPIHLT